MAGKKWRVKNGDRETYGRKNGWEKVFGTDGGNNWQGKDGGNKKQEKNGGAKWCGKKISGTYGRKEMMDRNG